MMAKERVEWIDILKLLGMVAIFSGHLGFETGGLNQFVFAYHVALFFFASGLTAYTLENLNFWQAIKKRFRQIIIPYIFIVVISMAVIVLTEQKDIRTYFAYGKQFILGIRNQMPASSLWFFSCLFCMTILFEILRRSLKRKGLILGAAILIYFITIYVFPHNPGQSPSWIFNIDSACFYLIYYVIGYLLHDKLIKAEERYTPFFGIAVIVLAIYAFSIYTQQDKIGLLFRPAPILQDIYPVLETLLLIGFNVVLAKLLTGIANLGDIGAKTLWLCGNEFIVKRIFGVMGAVLGIEIQIQSAMAAILCAVVMIVVIIKIFMPIEKAVYRKCLVMLGMEQ